MPLATKKLIVYIDQNIISNFVKAKARRISRPDLLTLFDVLIAGMRSEKLVCPLSWFHREEGSLTRLDPDIQRYLRYVGQVDFLPPWEVEERQFYNAARAFLAEEPYYSGWRECLEDNPDERLKRFVIDAHIPMAILNFRERRQRQAAELDQARSVVRGRTYAEQLGLERAEVAPYLYGAYPFSVTHLFSEQPSGHEKLAAFLRTDLAGSVTSMDLFTRLCASLLVHHNHRRIRTGDVTDMKILSTLLPYCHVMTTDTFMKELARALKLPERFGVAVFAGTPDEVAPLTDHIERLLATQPRANVPRLSLLVVPDEEIKNHLWDFFRALMRGAQHWELERHEWIELVNVNDGGYPVYQHPRSGLVLPDASFFFEFDDEISSEGRAAEEVARELQADTVVVVNSHHRLSRDFLKDVFEAVESGAPSVASYGWPIVRK